MSTRSRIVFATLFASLAVALTGLWSLRFVRLLAGLHASMIAAFSCPSALSFSVGWLSWWRTGTAAGWLVRSC